MMFYTCTHARPKRTEESVASGMAWSGRALVFALFVTTTGALGDDATPSRRDLIALADGYFDQPISVRPRSNDAGGIAWGDSYAMMACVEMLAATGEPKYADRLIANADLVLAARDHKINRKDEYRGKVVPAWGSTRYTQDKRYVWAVHTGMIAYPMARFAAVVKGRDKLRERYTEPAERLLHAAEEAIGVHDADFREGPGPDEGHLYGLHLKTVLPLNQQNALGRAWMAIDEARGSTRHADRVRRLARFFKNRLRYLEDQDLYVWSYWPKLDDKGTGAEDISHAAINADFLALCRARGIVFTPRDHDRVCNTVMRKIIRGPQDVADTVDGSGKNRYTRQILRWGRLAEHHRGIYDRLVEIAAHRDGPIGPTEAIGLAYLVSASASDEAKKK